VHSEVFEYNGTSGNLSGKGPDLNNLVTYYYDANHPHAVSDFDGNSYAYDANGNQITRELAAATHLLTYDAENHLIAVNGDPHRYANANAHPD